MFAGAHEPATAALHAPNCALCGRALCEDSANCAGPHESEEAWDRRQGPCATKVDALVGIVEPRPRRTATQTLVVALGIAAGEGEITGSEHYEALAWIEARNV